MATTITKPHEGSTLITTLAVAEVLAASIATDGLWQLSIDVTPLAGTETLRVEVLVANKSGGTERAVYDVTFEAGETGLKVFPPFVSWWAFTVQITQANGTKRTFDWILTKLDPA